MPGRADMLCPTFTVLFVPQSLMQRSNFAVEEPHLPALRAAHRPFSGNGRPAAWVAADVPHHVLGSWLFAAALAQARSNVSMMLNSLLHRRYFSYGLTAAFAGEVRFEITIGSGLQLD